MAIVAAELLALLKLDKKDYDKNLKDAKGDLESFDKRLNKAGTNIRNFGLGMSVATAPIAFGLNSALNTTKEFDSLMTNVNAILGITGTSAADLRAEILAYGGETRQGPIAVADAYYDIVSGVQDATTHMAILNAAVDTATAGQADLKATTSALIGAMNAYGFAADDAAFVSDVFTQTVKMGKLTMDELASAFPDVTGLAAEYGVSINDLGASLSYMTTTGTSASQSATFLKSMITTLLSPTADLQTAINALGYDTGEAMLNTLGLVGSYEALKTYNNGTFAGLITNQEALQGATKLTKDEFGAFNDTFQETVTGATAAAGAIQDNNVSWDQLRSKLEKASITIGTQLSPVIIALIDEAILPAVTAITAWMTENPELTQQLVLMAGAAVVLGPVISAVGVAVQVVSGIVTIATTLWSGIQALWAAAPAILSAAQAGVTGLGASMMATVGPIIAVGAAIAGVIAALNEFNNTVGTAQANARSALADEFSSGQIDKKRLDDAAFGAVSSQFGGGIIGDVAARLTYSNFADAVAGDSNIVSGNAPGVRVVGRAIGGGVSAKQVVRVNEDGDEYWRPDGPGEVIPVGDSRGGGAPVIHIYQQPGEDGVALANRVSRELVRVGKRRAA